MDQVVTIDMVHDAKILKNKLAEDEPPSTFQYQTLEPTDTPITGEELAMCQFLPFKLVSVQNPTVNKCQLQFGKEGKVFVIYWG